MQGVSEVLCVRAQQGLSGGPGEIDVVLAEGRRHLGMIHVECPSGCPGSPGEAFKKNV